MAALESSVDELFPYGRQIGFLGAKHIDTLATRNLGVQTIYKTVVVQDAFV